MDVAAVDADRTRKNCECDVSASVVFTGAGSGGEPDGAWPEERDPCRNPSPRAVDRAGTTIPPLKTMGSGRDRGGTRPGRALAELPRRPPRSHESNHGHRSRGPAHDGRRREGRRVGQPGRASRPRPGCAVVETDSGGHPPASPQVTLMLDGRERGSYVFDELRLLLRRTQDEEGHSPCIAPFHGPIVADAARTPRQFRRSGRRVLGSS